MSQQNLTVLYLKTVLTSNLSDLSSLLEGVVCPRSEASGRNATGCWRYAVFDPGTLKGNVDTCNMIQYMLVKSCIQGFNRKIQKALQKIWHHQTLTTLFKLQKNLVLQKKNF